MSDDVDGALQRAGIEHYAKIYLHPGNHVDYYPGAQPIHIKLLFSSEDGRILGAQAVGEATTSAVVTSILFIVIAASLLTILFQQLGI